MEGLTASLSEDAFILVGDLDGLLAVGLVFVGETALGLLSLVGITNVAGRTRGEVSAAAGALVGDSARSDSLSDPLLAAGVVDTSDGGGGIASVPEIPTEANRDFNRSYSLERFYIYNSRRND